MANITNPQAIKFVKEQVRPLCEKLRALKAEIEATKTNWFGSGINLVITNTSDIVVEGRNDGVPDLTGVQVNDAIGQLFGVDPNTEIIAKPCVRPLEAR